MSLEIEGNAADFGNGLCRRYWKYMPYELERGYIKKAVGNALDAGNDEVLRYLNGSKKKRKSIPFFRKYMGKKVFIIIPKEDDEK